MTYVIPFRIRARAEINSIQTGTVNIAANNASVTDTITAVTKNKSFLVFQYESANTTDNPQNNFVRGAITNSTTLTFTRANNPAQAVTIRWWVVEFSASSSASVQHGSRTLAGATDNVTVTAVTLANAFPLVTWSSARASNPLSDDVLTAELTTTTNLQFRCAANSTTTVIEWQVIENASWTVTKYTDVMDKADVTEDTPLAPSVTLADVWLVGYAEADDLSRNMNGNDHVRWQFTSTSNIQASKNSAATGFGYDLLYHIIDGGGKFATQHFQGEAIAAGNSTGTTALSPNIDTAKTIIKNNAGIPSYSDKNDNDDTGDDICVKHQINSVNQVQQERVSTSFESEVDFDVVDFSNSM